MCYLYELMKYSFKVIAWLLSEIINRKSMQFKISNREKEESESKEEISFKLKRILCMYVCWKQKPCKIKRIRFSSI